MCKESLCTCINKSWTGEECGWGGRQACPSLYTVVRAERRSPVRQPGSKFEQYEPWTETQLILRWTWVCRRVILRNPAFGAGLVRSAEAKARGPALIIALPSFAGGEERDGGEVGRDLYYDGSCKDHALPLLWQGLLSCEPPKLPCWNREFVRNKPSPFILRMESRVSTLVYSSPFSGQICGNDYIVGTQRIAVIKPNWLHYTKLPQSSYCVIYREGIFSWDEQRTLAKLN